MLPDVAKSVSESCSSAAPASPPPATDWRCTLPEIDSTDALCCHRAHWYRRTADTKQAYRQTANSPLDPNAYTWRARHVSRFDHPRWRRRFTAASIARPARSPRHAIAADCIAARRVAAARYTGPSDCARWLAAQRRRFANADTANRTGWQSWRTDANTANRTGWRRTDANTADCVTAARRQSDTAAQCVAEPASRWAA